MSKYLNEEGMDYVRAFLKKCNKCICGGLSSLEEPCINCIAHTTDARNPLYFDAEVKDEVQQNNTD